MNARLTVSGVSRSPLAAHEYMLYQALLGAWPSLGVRRDRAVLIERMQAFAFKAAREGKEQTSWLDPDARYEAAWKQFVRILMDRGQAFIDSFGAFANGSR